MSCEKHLKGKQVMFLTITKRMLTDHHITKYHKLQFRLFEV